MNTQNKIEWFIPIIVLTAIGYGDEISISLGANSSFYGGFNQDGIEYQKTILFNPIELSYEKHFLHFISFYSALQFSSKSIFSELQSTSIDQSYSVVPTGIVAYEKRLNYLSIVASPVIFQMIKKVRIDARIGFTGDIYINEWENLFDEETKISRNSNAKPIVLSFTTGVGVGYSINDKLNIGFRSNLARTLTDLFDDQNPQVDVHFLNWQNIVFTSISF